MMSNKRGCFCYNLRTAAFFHGWINIIVLIVLICITIKQILYNNPDDIFIKIYNISLRTFYRQQVISLVIFIFDVFLTALLIGGITIKNHHLLLPWMVIRAIELIIATPFITLTVFYAALTVKLKMIIVSLMYALIIGLFVWSWIIIYSLYGEIRKMLKVSLPMPSTMPYYEYQERQFGQLPASHNQFYPT